MLSLKQKIHYTYLESEIDALWMNLENLKSSVGIMQNILIYAEQLRNREQFPVLKEQQDLLKALGEEKLARSPSPGLMPAQMMNANVALGARSPHGIEDRQPESPTPSPTSSNVRLDLDDRELREYISLVAHMLEEVHSKRHNLGRTMRGRVHDGVLDLHWREWSPFRQYYKDEVLMEKFNQLPELPKFWAMKIKEPEQFRHKERVPNMEKRKLAAPEDRKTMPPPKEMHKFRILPDSDETEMEAKFRQEMEMKHQYERQKVKPEFKLRAEAEEEESRKQTGTAPSRNEMRLVRPTYIKVERRYLSKGTLDLYGLPWSVDTVRTISPLPCPSQGLSRNPLILFMKNDPKYLLILEYVDEDLMDDLFRDTRRRRARAEEQDRAEQPAPSKPSTSPVQDLTWSGLRPRMSLIEGLSQFQSTRNEAALPPLPQEQRLSSSSSVQYHTRHEVEADIQAQLHEHARDQEQAPKAPKAMNIHSLLSEWTTLSPREIARGRDTNK